MIWQVDPLSWMDEDGDVSWRFGAETDGRQRWVRAGVRISARALIIRSASRYLYGDWTPALLAYAAAAATLAPSGAAQTWVTRKNFAAVHEVVEEHRRQCEPLFHGGSMEDALQLGSPDGARRPEGDAHRGADQRLKGVPQ